jgi:chorismate-pyruvate lyase
VNAIRALCAAAALTVLGQGAEGVALVRTLNAELLASRSATQTLEKWCGDHRLAPEPTVVAHRIREIDKPADPDQRRRLQVTPDEQVTYRRVRLQCGTRVLSEADNWYVPARLTADMNRQLETTDTSFGTVVRPLEPTRRTLAVTMLWSGGLPVPAALFAHRAVLYTRDQVPFSEVYEVYQRALLP